MVCVIEAVWIDSMYRLEKIFDLSQPSLGLTGTIKTPASAYRILCLKGPFWSYNSNESIGLKVLAFQLEHLRDKERISPDCLVLMGPLLS